MKNSNNIYQIMSVLNINEYIYFRNSQFPELKTNLIEIEYKLKICIETIFLNTPIKL